VGLPEALRRAAEPGGREVVVAPDVAGRVTIRLQGVPWDQAFDVIARVNGLGWRDDGKTLRVARAADLR
jgi:type IV pilus assembly protein PilQ